ncbi:hypothetical protein BB561_004616 [Smittium simulii]|uniref:RNA-binding S4 domain-containing protein n=1 Tax=Smittium simulii TaxID=133385 RepID=A0A2T9YF76_9FUNG|nr:hypothetical protein BB561_004616 [Smittium simulii]
MLSKTPQTAAEPKGRTKTTYQQQWQAKKLTRAYHDADLTEKQIYKLIPRSLPTFTTFSQIEPSALMYAKLERRVDVIVFRSHFASSIWDARNLILTGKVSLNGRKFKYPSHLVKDGDVITVDPSAIITLQAKTPASAASNESSGDQETSEQTQPESTQQPAETETGSAGLQSYGWDRKKYIKKSTDSSSVYDFVPLDYQQPWMFLPNYLEVNYNICSTVFLREPTITNNSCELPSPYPSRIHSLAFLFYSKRGRR